MSRLVKPAWSFILERKKQSLTIVFFGLVSQFLTVMLPVTVGKYYELAFGMNYRRARFLDFIPASWWDSVTEFLLIFLLLICLRYGFYVVYQYLLRLESEFFIKSIKDKLFSHQLALDYSVYQEKGVGKYLLRYSGDLTSLKNIYLKGGMSVFIDVVILFVACAWFISLSLAGAMIIISGSLLAYALVYYFNEQLEQYSIEKRDRTAGQLSFVSRTLTGILPVILMNKQRTELKKYNKRSGNIVDSAAHYHQWYVINDGFIAFLQYAVLSIALYWFYLSENPHINGANLTSFILLYVTILPIIRRLFRLTTVYKLGNISVTKLNNLFDLPTQNVTAGIGKDIAAKMTSESRSLRFEKVDFGSGEISFDLRETGIHEQILPISLSSRALIYTLMGMPQNHLGNIYLNEVNLVHYAPEALRETFSLVSNELPLLGRSVYEAITTSRSERIKKASTERLTSVQDVLGIPENKQLRLDDKIGENGSILSAEQYEILCFVRGINTHKPILLVESFKHLSDEMVEELLNAEQKIIVWFKNGEMAAA